MQPDLAALAAVEPGYPFSAVVGQDQLRLALVLCAVHPGIGGVLVRGEKGTAKSTVVRALAALLPPVVDSDGPRAAKLVELPIGATEDRVVGSLDLERVLRDGERAFQPGLLAAAHLGVLYVDEVNLLHDHLVDVLLDAAAMGRVHVERDGISHSHAARFVLVGTMNPEEGELRPQLLDRFGLAVDVSASRDVEMRMQVVRRRLDFERDPADFVERYRTEDAATARKIADARAKLPNIDLDDTELRRIAALCASFDVDGMRGDLVVARTATAHAAWRGAHRVEEQDVRIAAELALPHRRRRDPFDQPGLDSDSLDEAMKNAAQETDSHRPPAETEGTSGTGQASGSGQPEPDPDGPDGGGGGGGETTDRESTPQQGRAGSPTDSFRARSIEIPGVGQGGAPGRRSRSRSEQGRAVRATPHLAREPQGLHVVATLSAAAEHQIDRGRQHGPLVLRPQDLRDAEREGKEGNLVVFVVDASGSMASRDRLSAVTGAVLSLLRDAYQRRDKVAVIVARGADAEIVLPPTSSVDIAATRLRDLRTGGKSPLAQGFLRAGEMIRRERVRDPLRRALVVTLTDGRATGGVDPIHRARLAASALARSGVASVMVDCESGMVRLGLARDLASDLQGGYVQLADLSAERVAGIVRAAA